MPEISYWHPNERFVFNRGRRFQAANGTVLQKWNSVAVQNTAASSEPSRLWRLGLEPARNFCQIHHQFIGSMT